MKKLSKKRVPIYSAFGILSLILFLTLPNLGWRTSRADVSALDEVVTMVKNQDSSIDSNAIKLINYTQELYETADLKEANLAFPVFEKALIGFLNLKVNQQLNKDKNVLTVVDFTKPSTQKRMWIIDINQKTLLLNTYVAHGQGSGEDLPKVFSNVEESHQSSLGFYVTNETYIGKHGVSLRLDGYDKGINDKARPRDIVVHGASYVSESFIKEHGRLGRSYGCPAVPVELTEKVIDLIKDKTCLFINGNQDNYQSPLLNQEVVLNKAFTIPQS